MRRLTAVSVIGAVCLAACTSAPKVYRIDAPSEPFVVKTGHLDLGGTAPDGGSVEVNSYYLSLDGKPAVPVLGEFHYCRYPRAQWEEQLRKMKAGGVTVVPCYVFWNVHEEFEGQWDWSGNRDLRAFVELCGKVGLWSIVRIGPFDHGEMRNGGIPDWIFTKPLDIRSNDPLYLEYVGHLYDQIAAQLEGLYYREGGPVIGIQVENEHQHSAASWAFSYPLEAPDYTAATYDADITRSGVSVQDREIRTREIGDEHMQILLSMARERGMDVPLYTATGWGNAAVLGNKGIPVTAGYPYPVWGDVNAMSPFCLFKDLHAEPDYAPVRYDPGDYPSFSVEMGAGIQIIYDKRPVIDPRGAEAMIVRCLGGGANAIGYYMYQGGSSPLTRDGQGFLSDANPKVSYDFQAPLGEFGLERPSYRYLRVLHSFLADFGDRLAPMEPVIPASQEGLVPSDRETLRYAARMKDGTGFLFVNNFQDHDTGRHAMDATVEVAFPEESLRIPVHIAKDAAAILPFRMDMDGVLLDYATAQPLLRIGSDWFFFAPEGMEPEYEFADGQRFSPVPGFDSAFTVGGQRIFTLTRTQAEQALRIGDRILFTDATAVPGPDGSVELLSLGNPVFSYTVFDGEFHPYTASAEVAGTPVCEVVRPSSRRLGVHVELPEAPSVHEWFLSLDYTGDVAVAFQDNRVIGDNLWQGTGPWVIGLNRFAEGGDIGFYIRPLSPTAPFLGTLPPENIPSFGKESLLEIREVKLVPQYRLDISL